MRILHVSLGLPPLRTGGLTRYATELMLEQLREGNEVGLLYPGEFLPGHTRVLRGTWRGIATFKVINPLPVALTFGVAEPEPFTLDCDSPAAYSGVLNDFAPDVIHVHSFMGVHREFFDIASDSDIPIVFTTHDYYPICPRSNLVNYAGRLCVDGPDGSRCLACCEDGMTLRKSIIMQSKSYSLLKDFSFTRRLRACVKRKMTCESSDSSKPRAVDADCFNLLSYNISIMDRVSMVLCNSPISGQVYSHYYPKLKQALIPITHDGLSFNSPASISNKDVSDFCFAYLGGDRRYKGFMTLIDAISSLHEINLYPTFDIYGAEYETLPEVRGVRKCGLLPRGSVLPTLKNYDAVIVPSLWLETFGFVVLEALSSGIPVICSDKVGASFLVQPQFIFNADDSFDLTRRILEFPEARKQFSGLRPDYPLSISDHARLVADAYGQVVRIQ